MCQNATGNGKAYIDPQLTRDCAASQDWRCYYCDCEMLDPADMPASDSPAMAALAERLGIRPYSSRWLGRVRHRRATAEHLTPISKGGSDAPENIVAACAFCNSRRGNLPEAEARAEIGELIRTGRHPCVKG